MALNTLELSQIKQELDELTVHKMGELPAGGCANRDSSVCQCAAAAPAQPPHCSLDDSLSDDEGSLPPYPDVFDGTMFDDTDAAFPTPVPAQIGIVRPLFGLDKPAPSEAEDDAFSVRVDKALKEHCSPEHAVQAFREKYDTLGKVTTKSHLATKIPEHGYVNTNAMTKSLPKRIVTSQGVEKTAMASATGRAPAEYNRSFSEILQIHSPARSLSMSLDSEMPDIASLMPTDYRPTSYALYDADVTHRQTSSLSHKGTAPVKPARVQSSNVQDSSKSKSSSSLTEHEILQIEMFYRSHKAQVFVSQCTADLYYGSARNLTTSADDFYGPEMACLSNWRRVKTGVPLLLLDSGESRRRRQLSVIFAEKGTGFALWRDQFNHLTNYQAKQAMFHTMHLSSDHSRLVAFRFHDAAGAADFAQKLNAIVSDPHMADILNLSSSSKKKKDKKRLRAKSREKLPDKMAISAPCCFTHITNLDRSDAALDMPASSKH